MKRGFGQAPSTSDCDVAAAKKELQFLCLNFMLLNFCSQLLIAKKKQMCLFKPRLTKSDYSHNALTKYLQKIENVIKDVEKLEFIVLLTATPTKIWEMLGMKWERKKNKETRETEIWRHCDCAGFRPGFFPFACVLSHLSRVWLCAIPWTAACQAPLSMGFSRQEDWSGVPSKWVLYHQHHLRSPFPYKFCLYFWDS